MTPQERQLVDDLFDRLAKLETAPRDPDAERAIIDGLRRAPNAVYALVQTALVQDEALKRADAKIRELSGAAEPQQQGGLHGGAMGALADIVGGYAALTLAPEGMEVTTVEYKINFLASFQGGELRATGHVVRAGKRVIVTTAQVVHLDAQGKQSECAVMQQTLVPVPKTY